MLSTVGMTSARLSRIGSPRIRLSASELGRTMPRFSLVIPTLQRSDTLRHSLATLVNQVYDDFEIVVQNNGRDGATEAVINSFDNRRIRHFWSDSVLPMAENWELALANTTGEFVTFVGDDDGLFPDACRLADAILRMTSVEIVNWRPF